MAKGLRKWLAATGAKTLYIEPGLPWENGYCESFNSKLRDEFLNGEIFYSLKELRVLVERWRVHYNTVRPHSLLGYRPPAPTAWLPQASQGHGKVKKQIESRRLEYNESRPHQSLGDRMPSEFASERAASRALTPNRHIRAACLSRGEDETLTNVPENDSMNCPKLPTSLTSFTPASADPHTWRQYPASNNLHEHAIWRHL